MPARKRKKKFIFIKLSVLIKYILVLALILLIILGITFLDYEFKHSDIVSVVFSNEISETVVVVFDKEKGEITQIKIPGDTQVEVTQGYGNLKLKNVNKFAESQKIDGSLLTSTITKNFYMPVYLWGGSVNYNILRKNPIYILKAIINSHSTNLKIADRISLTLFSLSVPETKRFIIDLSQTSYLKKLTLVNGEEGYLVQKDSLPIRVISIFVDPIFYEKNSKVSVVDGVGDNTDLTTVSSIIQSLGAKVVSVKKKEIGDIGCQVTGKDKNAVLKLAKTFYCEKTVINNKLELDIELSLGSKFESNF